MPLQDRTCRVLIVSSLLDNGTMETTSAKVIMVPNLRLAIKIDRLFSSRRTGMRLADYPAVSTLSSQRQSMIFSCFFITIFV